MDSREALRLLRQLNGDTSTGAVSTAVLHQAETWKTRDGRVLNVTDMDAGHRRNLLSYLRRNAERLKRQDLTRMDAQFLFGGTWLMSYNAADSHERYRDEVGRTPARKWVETLPLVRRLKELSNG